MDVKIENKSEKMPIKIIVSLCFFTIIVFWYFNSPIAHIINKDNILIAVVKKGNVQIDVHGYGELVSNTQKILTAKTNATVNEIVLKPGANVNKKSVIARLDNPELQQKFNNEKMLLSQIKANLRQLKLKHQRALLSQRSKLESLIVKLKTTSLYVEAHKKLVKSGTVSRITHETKMLENRLFNQQVDMQKQQITQLELINDEEINIQLEKIKQQQELLAIANNKLTGLAIVAGMDGILQKLSIELGQSLQQGQEIALIGSSKDLIAMIRVPQIKAYKIEINQNVQIEINQESINGYVVRIDPRVKNNTVSIEIRLRLPLPTSVRVGMDVGAVIETDNLDNVYYLERPVNASAHSNSKLFKLDVEQKSAKLVNVSFGKSSDKYIEIKSGAVLGDAFILSDTSSYSHNELVIE